MERIEHCRLEVVTELCPKPFIFTVGMFQFQQLLHQRRFSIESRPRHYHAQQAHAPVLASRFILLYQQPVNLQSIVACHLFDNQQSSLTKKWGKHTVEKIIPLPFRVRKIHHINWSVQLCSNSLDIVCKFWIHWSQILLKQPWPFLPCSYLSFTCCMVKRWRFGQ